MLLIKTILHATDFSKPSQYALNFACALARDYEARLILLHVVEPPVYYGELGMTIPLPADYHESLRDRLARLVPADGGIPVEAVLAEGNATAEILRLARDRHCDLIVLGTHGRSGLSRVLLGSIAEEVIRHSTVPVLTLKTPSLLDVEDHQPAATGAGDREAEERHGKGVLLF